MLQTLEELGNNWATFELRSPPFRKAAACRPIKYGIDGTSTMIILLRKHQHE